MIGRTNAGGSGSGSLTIGITVVGGTTKPLNPGENTIWVNTSTAIGNWYVQNTEPSSLSAGDVWVTLKPSISNVINLSENGSFLAGFGRTRQYISGAWVDKDAELFDGSTWQGLQTYVYNLGDLCTETTNGWTIYKAGSNCLCTFEETYFNHDYKSTTGFRGIFITNQMIDLTEYTQIHLDYEVTSAGSTGNLYLGGIYFTTATGSFSNAIDIASPVYTFHVSSQSRITATADITNFTGNYYVLTQEYYQKWKAFRIWLTK